MLVSHVYKFVYTKTIKTAGTSVESFFEKYCMPDGLWQPLHYCDTHVSDFGVIGYRGEDISSQDWYNHMPANLIREKVGVSVWDEYFKFCVVRNPYEKAISAFFFFKSKGNLGISDQSLDDVELFLMWLKLSGPPIDRCCYTINGEICVDFFIRYESLIEDIVKVCNKIGLPSDDVSLPRYKTEFRPLDATVLKMYCGESKRIVEQYYSFEFDYFGYKFPTSS